MELYILHDVLHVFFDTIPLVLEKHCEYRIQPREAIHDDAKADQLAYVVAIYRVWQVRRPLKTAIY
jgi:hypothetical protein